MDNTPQANTIPGDLIRGWRGAKLATGKSRVQLWRDIQAGRFPAPIELGANSIGWPRAEIEAWLAARPRRTNGRPARSDAAE